MNESKLCILIKIEYDITTDHDISEPTHFKGDSECVDSLVTVPYFASNVPVHGTGDVGSWPLTQKSLSNDALFGPFFR